MNTNLTNIGYKQTYYNNNCYINFTIDYGQ